MLVPWAIIQMFKRGKSNNYLRMNLEFGEKVVFTINMINYTKTIFADFPEEITWMRPTPYADHLFKVRDKCKNTFCILILQAPVFGQISESYF